MSKPIEHQTIERVRGALSSAAQAVLRDGPNFGVVPLSLEFTALLTAYSVGNGSLPIPPFGHTFLEVFVYSTFQNVIAVYGGSNLTDPAFRDFALRLAPAFVEARLSIVGGAGPGIPMCEFFEAFGGARSKGDSPSRFVVPSPLADELPHDVGDPHTTVTPQLANAIREEMIEELGNGGAIAFPGNVGTGFEVLARLIGNYVAPRTTGAAAQRVKPLVLLDQRDDKFRGGSFWRPLIDLLCNAQALGLSKNVPLRAYVIDIARADAVARTIKIFTTFANKGAFVEEGFQSDCGIMLPT